MDINVDSIKDSLLVSDFRKSQIDAISKLPDTAKGIYHKALKLHQDAKEKYRGIRQQQHVRD